MPTNGATTPGWTHRAYFKRFKLNVEQYGEILIAQAFAGEKKGDSQPCFDIETTELAVRKQLLNLGLPLEKYNLVFLA